LSINEASKRIGGSNPPLSAILSIASKINSFAIFLASLILEKPVQELPKSSWFTSAQTFRSAGIPEASNRLQLGQ